MAIQKRSRSEIHSSIKEYLHSLHNWDVISQNTKKEIADRLSEINPYDKKEFVESIMLLKPHLNKIRKVFKNPLDHEAFKNEAQADFPDMPEDEIEALLPFYLMFHKYKEFLKKKNINHIHFKEALQNATWMQHIKRRIKNPLTWEYGMWKWLYMLERDEPWVVFPNKKITKYIPPLFIRIKRVTNSSLYDLSQVRGSLPPVAEGDYIIEFDISPHDFQKWIPLRKAFQQLQSYLQSNAIQDIKASNAKHSKNHISQEPHIALIYWITHLHILAEKAWRHIANMPLALKKQTSTYYYWLHNPYGKYTEQPAALRILSPDKYKQMEKIGNKYDASDIRFCYTTIDELLANNMSENELVAE